MIAYFSILPWITWQVESDAQRDFLERLIIASVTCNMKQAEFQMCSRLLDAKITGMLIVIVIVLFILNEEPAGEM